MKRILILGANGQITRLIEARLLNHSDVKLSLYLRDARRLSIHNSPRVNVIDGDVNDLAKLTAAMKDQDLVIADLSYPLKPLAGRIVRAMDRTHLKRLVYITGWVIDRDLPRNLYERAKRHLGGASINDAREAARIIERSRIDYTIVRSVHMSNEDEVNYKTIPEGAPFNGSIVSRKSIADYVIKIAKYPQLDQRSSIGIDKPSA